MKRDGVELYYLTYFERYRLLGDPDVYRWQPHRYYLTLGYPAGEMTDATCPMVCASDFMRHTAQLEWRKQNRRAIEAGDVMVINDKPYMFIPESDAPYFIADGRTVLCIPDWPNLHLLKLEYQHASRP